MRLLAVLLAALFLVPAAAQAAPPPIEAPEAIVVEPTTGDVVFEKEADTPRPMASTTKLMTALLTLESGRLKDVVTAPRYNAIVGESLLGLVPGEKITVQDLLRALLIDSSNDAAYALARHIGGGVPSFVRQMNRRADQLGLDNTSYANPIGLDDPGNFSTARDLATLTMELRKDRLFRRTVNAETFTLRSGATTRTLRNSNDLLAAYPWVNGVKTGYTSLAGEVLVSSGRKDDVSMLAVVMGATSEAARDEQSLQLLNYGFERFELARATVKDERWTGGTIPVEDRPGADLSVVFGRTVEQVVRKDARFTVTADLPEEVAGPIGFHERMGTAVVSLDGEEVARVPLLAAVEVPEAGFGRRLQNFLTAPWMLLVLGAILLAATAATQRRTPPTRSRRGPPAEEPTA